MAFREARAFWRSSIWFRVAFNQETSQSTRRLHKSSLYKDAVWTSFLKCLGSHLWIDWLHLSACLKVWCRFSDTQSLALLLRQSCTQINCLKERQNYSQTMLGALRRSLRLHLSWNHFSALKWLTTRRCSMSNCTCTWSKSIYAQRRLNEKLKWRWSRGINEFAASPAITAWVQWIIYQASQTVLSLGSNLKTSQ